MGTLLFPLLLYLQSTTITSKDIMWRNIIILLVFLSALSDARQLRRRARSLKHATSQTCRDGSTRSCTCTDGTMADLTSKPCPGDSHPDVENGCHCPAGYDETPLPGRTHGLHQVCSKEGETIRPICTCTDQDKTLADWAQHPCKESHVKKCQCKK